jgi:hypothetical protein
MRYCLRRAEQYYLIHGYSFDGGERLAEFEIKKGENIKCEFYSLALEICTL